MSLSNGMREELKDPRLIAAYARNYKEERLRLAVTRAQSSRGYDAPSVDAPHRLAVGKGEAKPYRGGPKNRPSIRYSSPNSRSQYSNADANISSTRCSPSA